MQYTHHHGYDSDYVPTLRRRKHRSQRNDLQLQAALLVQGLRQEFSREPPAERLHRRKARRDLARLPGEIQPEGAFPNLRRLAQHRDELARKKSQALPELSQTLARPDPDDHEATALELDELWSFVLKKTRKRWVWLALCRKTRQVVAYFIGDRSEASCRELWERVPEAYRGGHCYSDFWKAYREVIPEDQHEAVGKESGDTAHIERWNNTLRQRLSRFVRKSLSFSKSDRMHEICLRLFLHRYNLSHLP
jgi:insertion element IS1 protein InsB